MIIGKTKRSNVIWSGGKALSNRPQIIHTKQMQKVKKRKGSGRVTH